MKRIVSSGAVAALVAIVAACADAGRPAGAGAEAAVVDNRAHAKIPEWTFSPEPVAQVGGGDEDALVMVTAGVLLGDRIYLADAGAAALRIFDGEGKRVSAVGRRGSAPGEFQHLTWMGLLPGDSLAVWDPVLRRLSVFGRDGRFARALTLRALRGSLPGVHGVFADGSLLVSAPEGPSAAPRAGAVWRDTVAYLIVGLDGEIRDTLGRFPGTEWHSAPASGRVSTVPMGRQTVALARGDAFHVGTGESYELSTYRADGSLRMRIRKPHRPVPVSREEIRAYQAGIIQVGGSESERRERTRELEQAPYPPTLPPYVSVAGDAAGNLWVREAQPPSTWNALSRWSVFDPAGRLIATVRGPGRFRPLQIGRDWILGTETGADEVEHVRVYALRKPS